MEMYFDKKTAELFGNNNKEKNDKIYDFILFSIKGSYVCKDEKKRFKLSNTQLVSSQKNGNEEAKDMLNCFCSVVEKTKNECKSDFDVAKECLEKNKINSTSGFEKCADKIEFYLGC
jgi:hypothetical protein